MTNQERVLNKDTLINLYQNQGLSTHEIAKMFSITPQAVRYWCIKNNIKLRKPKSLQRKRYKISKELLEELYLKQKLSIPKIASRLGIKYQSTVQRMLMRFGIPRRSMSEAKTKYPKLPFSGNLKEKAYLLGLRVGDISVLRDFYRIRVTNSSTHPAQIEMIKRLFEKYTHVNVYVHKDKRDVKEFHIQCDLHQSFDFLLKKIKQIPKWIVNNNYLFFSFLAGYSDAEANWNISKHGKNSVQIEFNLRTNDKKILQQINSKLISRGFNSKFRLYIKRGKKATYGKYTKDVYSSRIIKKFDVIKLAKILLPLSKHDEKVRKMKLIINMNENTKWQEIKDKVLSLRNEIKNSRLK